MDTQSHGNTFTLKDANVWALVSFALIGFIAGYGFSEIMRAQGGPGAQPSVQQPSPDPSPSPRPAPQPSANPATTDDDPFLGRADAPVTMIEFTDYQCPFCGRHFSQTFDQIKSDYIDTGKVKYVVRDYPLGFHEFAQKASEATECAEDQGKFWEYHDTLFRNQSALDVPSLKRYAVELGLDTAAFDTCLDTGTHEDEVKKDFADGSAAGITGTPGFFINDKKVSGAQPFSSFQAIIDAEL